MSLDRIVRVEEKITQPHGQGLAAQCLLAGLSKAIQIQRLWTETGFQRFAPYLVPGYGMITLLGNSFCRIPQQVDPVPRREIQF